MRGVSWTLGAVALLAAAAGGIYYEGSPHIAGLLFPLAAIALGATSLFLLDPRSANKIRA